MSAAAEYQMVADGRIRIYPDLIQGSDEWFAARCGMLTASEMCLIVTPKALKAASNDKERAHLYELLAQRITRYVEPHYVSDDMLRGKDDEWEALRVYAENYAPVQRVGFVTNDKWGFTIGYSPDALVGDDGQVECKSRRQKYQIQTLLEHGDGFSIPAEFVVQVQTGLMVTEREWTDFVSYSGGLPMVTIRCHPDPVVQDAIISIAADFEARLAAKLVAYRSATTLDSGRLIPTERKIEQEMFV